MMLSIPELIVLLLICGVTFLFHKQRPLSRRIARLRLHFDKGVSEEYVEEIAAEAEARDKSD